MASKIYCDVCGVSGTLAGGEAYLPCGHTRFYLPLNQNERRFPPLYECSVCGAAVKVTVLPEGEPAKEWSCPHTTAPIWANRKVTLRGKGALEAMNPLQRGTIKLTLTVRQFLSALLGRSI